MRRVLIWLRNGVLVLLGLILLAAGAIYGLSESRMRQSFAVPSSPITVPAGDAAIAEGHRLSIARGCVDCHSTDMSGSTFIDAPPIGTYSGSNLTSGAGGVGKEYTPETWARAIRHGIAADGSTLLFMPSHEFAGMSDADVGALIAYLQSVPAVDKQLPAISVGPLGRILYLQGQLPLVPAQLIDHQAKHEAPAVVVSVEYGGYLAAGCVGCHGQHYSGGAIPGGPPEWPHAQNITPDQATGIGSWSEEDFIRAIREGKRPDGTMINEVMPWKNLSKMTDTELKALYLFLMQVPARAEGQR